MELIGDDLNVFFVASVPARSELVKARTANARAAGQMTVLGHV